MKKLSFKTKLIGIILLIVLGAGGILGLVLPYLNKRYQRVAQSIVDSNQQLADAQSEEESLKLARSDLEKLKGETEPTEFFSNDINVVNEIKTLERNAKKYDVQFNLDVTGKASAAPKLSRSTLQLSSVPYTMSVEGGYTNVMNFITSLNHVDFLTYIKDVNITSSSPTSIRATLTADFYVK